MVRAIQNKAFFKALLKLEEPKTQVIEESLKSFKKSEEIFTNYYLKDQKFLGGNQINVCDLIASSTFEQVNYEKLKKNSLISNFFQAILCDFDYDSKTKNYLERCRNEIEDYDEILTDLKKLKQILSL